MIFEQLGYVLECLYFNGRVLRRKLLIYAYLIRNVYFKLNRVFILVEER